MSDSFESVESPWTIHEYVVESPWTIHEYVLSISIFVYIFYTCLDQIKFTLVIYSYSAKITMNNLGCPKKYRRDWGKLLVVHLNDYITGEGGSAI